jgi:hypothetical protein
VAATLIATTQVSNDRCRFCIGDIGSGMSVGAKLEQHTPSIEAIGTHEPLEVVAAVRLACHTPIDFAS